MLSTWWHWVFVLLPRLVCSSKKIRAVSKFCMCVSSAALRLCCCWLNVLLWCNTVLSWLSFFLFCLFWSISCDYTSLLSVVFAAPVSIQTKPDVKLCLKATPYLWGTIGAEHMEDPRLNLMHPPRLQQRKLWQKALYVFGFCFPFIVLWSLLICVPHSPCFGSRLHLILKLFIFDWFLIYVPWCF